MYALLDEYKIKVPDVDKAGYVSLDSTYAGLKALMEEVEAAKEENIGKYSSTLEQGAPHWYSPWMWGAAQGSDAVLLMIVPQKHDACEPRFDSAL